MDYSMHNADRRTHLKIVVIGLLCATIVAAIGIFARVNDVDLGTAPLVKAGRPTAVSGRFWPSTRPVGVNSGSWFSVWLEHDLFLKPASTFRDHALQNLAGAIRSSPAWAAGAAGSDSTALPVNRTGPVGAPLGEPPLGSSDTA